MTDGLLRNFRQTLHPDLVLVVIDDESLRALGRFPFDRTVYAQLLDRLKDAGAQIVAFDILFVEPAPSDEVFAEAMRRFGKVILGVNLSFEGESKVAKRFLLPLNFPLPLRAVSVALPPEPLLSACSSLGFVYPFPDRDGVCRSLPLAINLTETGRAFPSLSLAAAIAWLGKPKATPNYIRWGSRKLHLGSDWDILVLPPFSPERVGFPSLSFARVLKGDFDPTAVRGKLVLVGMSASGLSDRLPTPTDPLAHGIEIHAAAINALLTGNSPRYAPFWLQILATSLLCISISTMVLLRRFYQNLITFVGLMLITYLSALLSLWWGIIVPPMPLFLSMVVAFTVASSLLLEIQSSVLERIRAYVAQPIEEAISSPPEKMRTGERREITVLFSDIRNFTQVAATLSPYEVVSLLESYFNHMVEIVHLYGGVIDKFLGDGMMVLFGVPYGQADSPQRAVLCAWQMLEELSAVNREWERITGSPLRIGIGINTGIAVIGKIGTEWRKELTALGATVNLAQRLEQLTKDVGADLLIGESTYQRVSDLVLAEPLRPIIVKGFDQPVVAYRVTGLTELGQRLRKAILTAKV